MVRPLAGRIFVALVLSLTMYAHAQVLARPGLRGSGMSVEPWWQSAVFYRIVPEYFQDSDGDGVGDLRGIAQRLDYLQTLGVDAIVLQLPFEDTGFDDLLADTTRRHIRIVIGLRAMDAGAVTTETFVAEAQHWLARGAAGIFLPSGVVSAGDDLRRISQLSALRRVVTGFPGQRVLITTESSAEGAGQLTLRSFDIRSDPSSLDLANTIIDSSARENPALYARSRADTLPAPLLQLQQQQTGLMPSNAAPLAAVLLTQRSAVLLEYGQELGILAPKPMPWTPSDVTPPPPMAQEAPRQVPSSGEVVYGPYRPYVPPPPPKPKALSPEGVVLPDPDSLPGFSTIPFEHASPLPVRSVVLQERDPRSLLNLYRTLVTLHHGNATLRDGSISLLHADSATAVWLRRAPAGTRTSAPILVAINTGDQPAILSLATYFEQRHLHANALRSLLGGGSMSIDTVALAPHGVFVGELVYER